MSTAARRIADDVCMRAILSILAFAPGQTLPIRRIQGELDDNHGQSVTTERLGALCVRMADMGLIQHQDGLAKLAEPGRDVVFGRTELPGA